MTYDSDGIKSFLESLRKAKRPEPEKPYFRIERTVHPQPKKMEKKHKLQKRDTSIHGHRCRNRHEERRLRVLSYYSAGPPICAECGITDVAMLCLDHIMGDGAEHRKQLNGKNIYTWIVENNYPVGFQVLCHNCNFKKGTSPW